ncbi:MAG: transporter substrate-binding domain-containing protein [Gammaproteobacteria bacterium]|nr:transporter substrate-binding domain-containing protein [Gammaproteobacteria bacterium]
MVTLKRPHLILLLLISVSAVSAIAEDRNESMQRLSKLDKAWSGDLDGMIKRRRICALVTYNKMLYFIDKGTQRGVVYEALEEFEKFVNKKHKTGTLKIDVVFIPVNRDELLLALLAGKGDIAAANLTITDARSKLVAFSDPLLTGVSEVVVTGPGGPEVTSLAGLSEQEIYVRRSSSYYESLTRLNETFRQQGRPLVRLKSADEHLEDSDLLEMVNAGLIPMVIVDSHKVQFWREIFSDIRGQDDIAVNEGGRIAWAYRKNSPQLAKTINEFLKSHKKGTLMGNVLYKRYLRENKWVRNALSEKELEKFRDTLALFQKYAGQYDFD